MKLPLYFLLPMLVSAFTNSSLAQINISGYVLDATEKEPLIGTHIFLLTSFEKSTITDQNGFFRLTNLTSKDTLLVSFMGYKERLLTYGESNSDIEILLVPLQLKLQEVVVKSTVLGAENFAFEQLEPIDIYLNPTAKADALVAVNSSVSSTTTDENAAVSFRGASPNQTGYFLNGVPIKNPVKYAQLTNTGTLSIFNTDFLKSATVFPGNPPVEYGQSTSGTIVIEMADRFSDGWQQTASISLANMGYAARGKLGEQIFLGIFSNYQFDDALKASNPRNFKDINTFASVDAGILINSHQKWGSLKFYQYGLRDNYEFQYQHPSYENGFLHEAIRSVSTFQWIQEFNKWQIRLVLGNSYTAKKFRFGNLDFHQTTNDPYSAVHFSWLKEHNLLKLGYSYWDQQNNTNGYFPKFSYALAPTHPSQYVNQATSLATHEVYAFYRKIINKHSFGAGIRTGKVPQMNKKQLSYQLNYLWKTHEQFQVKAGIGRYYQTRNTDQDKASHSNQLAIDFNFKNTHFAIDQSLYFNQVNNENIKGSETTFTFKNGKKLQFDQSVSVLSHADENVQWFTRTFFVYKPFALWSFDISYQSFEGNTVQIITSANYNSDLNVYEPNNTENKFTTYDPYQNLSLSINRLYNFREITGIFFITFNNLLDIKNSNDINYNFDYSHFNNTYLTRRSFYLGLVINF